MYCLDGSSKLPYTLRSSYKLSPGRAKLIGLAMDLIEAQARLVEAYVKIGDFDSWCICASELVDLMLDLVLRDHTYLLQNGMLIHADSQCQLLALNSHFVNLVSFLTFELT